MKISEHISYAEAFKSQTATRYGIDNSTKNQEILSNMAFLAENIFEKVRNYFAVPIAISCFYRSEELNKKVGGARASQHTTGEAMDIDADVFGKVTNKQIFDFIAENLEFDQLILEGVGQNGTGGWIHVSLKKNGKNRKQKLRATFNNGIASYSSI